MVQCVDLDAAVDIFALVHLGDERVGVRVPQTTRGNAHRLAALLPERDLDNELVAIVAQRFDLFLNVIRQLLRYLGAFDRIVGLAWVQATSCILREDGGEKPSTRVRMRP